MGGLYYSNDTLADDDKHGVISASGATRGSPPLCNSATSTIKKGMLQLLPGNYSMAVYYDSNRYEDLSDPSESRDGHYGFYFHADQMVYEEPGSAQGQGSTPFLTATFTPLTEINQIPYFVMGGVVYRGLLPRRDHDTTSFGVAYGQFSDQLDRTHEMAFELSHEFQVISWLSLQPDVQYILRPGRTGNIPDG